MEINKEEPQQRELTFGEKLVGLRFNPSGDEKVNRAKQLMADVLDLLKEVETEEVEKSENGISRESWEKGILRTNAIGNILDAQMSLVKYITWNN
jgi:hypothetical protein